MTVPAPPSLGSVPSPAPTTADPDNFDARADAFHQVFPDLVNKALPAMLAWIKAAADMIKGWAGVAQDSASTARAESGKAATSAAQAASGASTAVAGANAAGASATAAAASQTAAKGSADAAKLSADQAASSAGVASSGGIRWDRAQSLTAAQQAQALANIGATAVSSVGADLLRNFQYSGMVDRPDGGGTERIWDPSGSLLISNAVGGHALGSKRSITLEPGVYCVSMSAVFLEDKHAWGGTPVEKMALPIYAQAWVTTIKPDGTDDRPLGVITFESNNYLNAEGASETSSGFLVTEPTRVRPMLALNGWEGGRKIVITSIVLGSAFK